MLLGNHYDKHAAKPLLDIRAKLFDGSEVHLHAQDTQLVFKINLWEMDWLEVQAQNHTAAVVSLALSLD